MKNINDLKVLITNDEITQKIKLEAEKINNYYEKNHKNETLVLICILKGAVMFFSELVKYLKMPLQMEFISLSSYGNSQKSTGEVKSINLTLPDLENKIVLIVEDIIDTGLTLDFLTKYIKTNCKVRDVKLASLFNKKCARKYAINPDFYCFDIDDKFIIGFGLDYCGLYRNLNYIGYFE